MVMRKWNQWRVNFALKHRHMKLAFVAAVFAQKPKAICEFYRKRGVLRIPNYNDQEIEWLRTLPLEECCRLMPNRSINALRIKKWRLCTPAKASAVQQAQR